MAPVSDQHFANTSMLVPLEATSAETDERNLQLRSILDKQMQKTRLCQFYMNGFCKYNEKCTFAHERQELQHVPDLRRTRICKAFVNGGCNDPTCNFAHGREELRATQFCFKTTMCVWHAKGQCKNGKWCRFAHGRQELRANNPNGGGEQQLPADAQGQSQSPVNQACDRLAAATLLSSMQQAPASPAPNAVICVCGIVFNKDANFCNECGSKRPQKAVVVQNAGPMKVLQHPDGFRVDENNKSEIYGMAVSLQKHSMQHVQQQWMPPARQHQPIMKDRMAPEFQHPYFSNVLASVEIAQATQAVAPFCRNGGLESSNLAGGIGPLSDLMGPQDFGQLASSLAGLSEQLVRLESRMEAIASTKQCPSAPPGLDARHLGGHGVRQQGQLHDEAVAW